VAGLVLHNAFYSVSAILDKQFKVLYYEPFPNGELIKRVRSPVFIIHGTKDDVIPITHGQKLAAASGSLFEFWPVIGANHGNVETRDEYFMKLDLFFRRLLSNKKTDVTKGESEKINHVYREYF
jgi:pimeloyl-ACP methyl ester carboxylesterase